MRVRGGQKAERSKESAFNTTLSLVFVLFYVLCFIICSSVSLSLSFVVVVVVVRDLCFWSRGFYRAKNSILSVKKNVLNTHARAYVCTARVREFSSGAFIIALDV